MAHEYTAWAYSQPIPGAGRKFVLVALADRANGDGYSFPGQKSLAAMTGQSERSVREHLEWLEENDYVRRKERRRKDGTRTSDEYYLPPMDSTGNIRRWSSSGNSRRLTGEATNDDQDTVNTPSTTGSIRRLSAPRSTGRFRRGHRQNSPVDAKPTSDPSSTTQTPHYQPAESAGHESFNHQKEPSAPPTPPTAAAAETPEFRKQPPLELSQEVLKALATFRQLHGPKANDHMMRTWLDAIRTDVAQHSELDVIEALQATIDNFPSLSFPFKFYRACLKTTTNTTTDKPTRGGLDTNAVNQLIADAKEGILK